MALLSSTELAQQLGCSEQTIRRLALQLRVAPVPGVSKGAARRYAFTIEQATQIAEHRRAHPVGGLPGPRPWIEQGISRTTWYRRNPGIGTLAKYSARRPKQIPPTPDPENADGAWTKFGMTRAEYERRREKAAQIIARNIQRKADEPTVHRALHY